MSEQPTTDRMTQALRDLMRAYVNTLENARDRIIFLGGECDSLATMVDGDPALRAARAAIEQPPEPAAEPACQHPRASIVTGYQNNYGMAWCGLCGTITWCSDGCPPHGLGRSDRSNWMSKNIAAWSCQSEAQGRSRCKEWCGHQQSCLAIKTPAAVEQAVDDAKAEAHSRLMRALHEWQHAGGSVDEVADSVRQMAEACCSLTKVEP